MKPNSWAVACTCHEPTPLMIAFVAHYLSIGAAEIHLFFDRPQPRCQALLAALPKVHITQCDDAHWARHNRGKRPPIVIRRQLINAYIAYEKTDCDWLLHVDADEFLTTTHPLDHSLAQVAPAIRQVRFQNLERAMLPGAQSTIFDGVFRIAPPKEEVAHSWLLSRDRNLTIRGFTGHVSGKSIYRTRKNVIPGIHSGRLKPTETDDWIHHYFLPTGRILHFDGLTRRHWMGKLLRLCENAVNFDWLKGMTPERHNQVVHILKARNRGRAARQMHNRLKVLNRDELSHLRALGLVDETPFSPLTAVAKLGLPEQIDFSPETFDNELAALLEEQEQPVGVQVPRHPTQGKVKIA